MLSSHALRSKGSGNCCGYKATYGGKAGLAHGFEEISVYHVREGTIAEHLSPGQWE